jgi:hypothetical protein
MFIDLRALENSLKFPFKKRGQSLQQENDQHLFRVEILQRQEPREDLG